MTKTTFQTKDITYCAAFASLIAACAWISVPTSVPFTMQTFAVFATLLILGGRLGTFTILGYLLLGAVGVPVFAGFSGGIGSLIGATGGYLLGFLVIGLSYAIFIKEPLEKPFLDVTVLSLGLFLCYFLGTMQFVFVYSRNVSEIGIATALGWCVFPFLLPDLLKLAMAVLLAKKIRPYLK